jgi:hypothetical protein
MEPTQPNEHGVLVDYVSLPVFSDKKTKTELEIQVACGPDGRFYSGYDYKFYYVSGTPGCGGCPSYRVGRGFDSIAAAVMYELIGLRKKVDEYAGKSKKTDTDKIIAAINDFSKSYETDAQSVLEPYFCHPIGGDWTRYPLPDIKQLTRVEDMPVCGVCPLATRPHIMIPVPDREHSYAKYCTITAIIAGLVTTEQALCSGQGKISDDERIMVDAIIERLGHCSKSCSRRTECISLAKDPEHDCLIKRDSGALPAVVAIIPDPDASPAESEPKPKPAKKRPLKPAFIFGWMSAETVSHYPAQLYVERTRNDWGVSYDPDHAARFKSVDAIIDYYRKIGTIHEDHEAKIYNGYLKIFEYGPAGLRQIPRLTRQASLFENLLEPEELQPELPNTESIAVADIYSRDENLLLGAGFILVRYDRDKKTVQRTWDNYLQGWAPEVMFNTYAAAERTLKEMLQMGSCIEVDHRGKVVMNTSAKKLYAAGFDFYRTEGVIPGHGSVPRIKSGRKNWSTVEKFEHPFQLKNAWDELMKDKKALCG